MLNRGLWEEMQAGEAKLYISHEAEAELAEVGRCAVSHI